MSRPFRHLAVALGLAALTGLGSPVLAATREGSDLTADSLDPIASWYRGAPIVGMTVAIARADEPPLIVAWGHVDAARTEPATPHTVYEIGSITKTFTAALILRRVEQGPISLDETVTRWLPELRGSADEVTVRHLLAHSSGLPSDPVAEDMSQPVSAEALLAAVRDRPAEFSPGARFRYNNNGYGLLGLILERESGRAYADLLREELLEPLGLSETAPCAFEDATRPAGFNHAFISDDGPVLHIRHHPLASGAAGMLCSTAGDVLAWQSGLMSGRVLQPQTLALMTEPQRLSNGSASPYGLGIYVDEDGERLHHGGAASGFITQMAWRPRERLGVVVLTNGIYAGALAERLEQDLAGSAMGRAWSPPVEAPMSQADLEALAGAYRIGPTRLDVFVLDGRLRARPEGQVAARLLHQGGGVFRAEHDPELVITFPGDGTVILEKAGRALPTGRRDP
ncbi:MAG: serine hydrolase domain-containing protein [Brevundimonas sp.]|uniref:serine hydrolase domain-containing protein n=1 Tax=Brevundimonas sp. TaxID=1871086 RepID=UPI002ABC33A4|nr:serine hydrolase domain-containing protein [Brevundimonas sp.]MDZ4113702.1 serine hydrolase domain-containing protein [Brevundimonas sp.]